MKSEGSPTTEDMAEFSSAIGELILWTNMIDVQVNQALTLLLTLPDHAFVKPIVAQLDIRPKLEIIKKRLKFLPSDNAWRLNILKWTRDVEKVCKNRNHAAHCRIQIRNDKIKLTSSQLTKIF